MTTPIVYALYYNNEFIVALNSEQAIKDWVKKERPDVDPWEAQIKRRFLCERNTDYYDFMGR